MDRLESILSILDLSFGIKRKKHIVGGILMSATMLFGGLALTVLTLKMEEDDDDNDGRNYY